QGGEYGLSQVFMAININAIAPPEEVERIIQDAVNDLAASKPDGTGTPIVYPGQRRRAIRERNEAEGIPVDERVWDEIISLQRK
ncbi:MAG: Ldh family oxidoreductase, partial [Rectinema sp.]|nr:Ldh family oxidoreductase [Rectinema sp.]